MITIVDLIDTNYTIVSILEDIPQVQDWLLKKNYLAVMDEELKITGIITRTDIRHLSQKQVSDCAFMKPGVSPLHTIFEVYEVMTLSKATYLPVFDQDTFCGVVSLDDISLTMIKQLRLLGMSGKREKLNRAS